MSRADLVFDNPMLTKHLRSRLRPTQVAPWLVVVVILCLFIIWAGQAFNWLNNGFALSLLLGLEAIILAIVGTQQVAGSVGGSRESGVLDFHRVSPQPPTWLVTGYFLGAPIREYALFLVTVPFAVFLAYLSPLGLLGLMQVWVAVIVGAWIFHLIALLSALVSRKPKGTSKGGVAGLVITLLFLANPVGQGLYYASSSMTGETPTVNFYGQPVYWLLFLLLYTLPLLGFFFVACVRKMRSEKAHPYTKLEAVGGMATLAVLTLGACWGYPEGGVLAIVTYYVLALGAIVWISTITPSHAEYVRGLRLAFHRGQRRPSPWSDEGMNRVAVFVICGIVLVAGTIASQLYTPPVQAGPITDTSIGLAVAVFTAAYVGFGQQYFLLRLPTSGRAFFMLFLFVAWLVPILAGSLTAASASGSGGALEEVAKALLGISPVTGITVSSLEGARFSNNIEPGGSNPARLAAILPAIAFAFVFNHLLVGYQRKVDRTVRHGVGPVKEAGPFDDLEAKDPVGDGRAGALWDGESAPSFRTADRTGPES